MGDHRDFDYYCACGCQTSTSVETQPGILLIGGAEGDSSGEHEATQWFLQRAKGGRYLGKCQD